jgi:cytochrome c oxidase subunit 2
MGNNQSGSGSRLVAATLAFILVAFTFSTIYVFAARIWWPPETISPMGPAIDAQLIRTLIICGVIFFLAQLALAFVILRYRDRGQRAHYSHGNNTMEIISTSATAILFLALGIAAESAWNFRYPGPDGTFGRTDPTLINDSAGNPLGVDFDDPAAEDDIITPVMAVPLNQEVEVILLSKDVLHSFFVRELRFKQDTVPGLAIRLHFTANKVGRYEIVCAELCGMQHHRMRTYLQVLPPDEYQSWLQEQAAF